MTLRRSLVALAICVASLAAAPVMADDYPNRPLRLIVPYAAGGTADAIARIVGKHLAASLGQAVVIDDRAGAGGLIGAGVLTQSAADGYTIGVLATPHVAAGSRDEAWLDREIGPVIDSILSVL